MALSVAENPRRQLALKPDHEIELKIYMADRMILLTQVDCEKGDSKYEGSNQRPESQRTAAE